MDGFTVAIKETGYQKVRAGELVIHTMDAFAGAVGVSESNGKCTGEYVVCEPWDAEYENKYFALLVREMALKGYIYVICPSVRERAPRFRFVRFKDVELPVPPPQVQKGIVRFLDRKTAAVDALIAKKRRLVELLAEKRAALINQAVTKGLDPTVPTKDSGIPWIGEIPAHWEVKKTRFVCTLTTGSRDTQDALENGPYPFFVRSQTVERCDSWSFDGEGVLTAGDGAGVAKVFHHHCGKKEVHQRVYLYHMFKGVGGRFFYYFLRENLRTVALAGNAKSTVDSLRRPMLLDFPIVVPPMCEQQVILDQLDQIDAVNLKAECAIGDQVLKLQEYRQALITAAVTGQLEIPVSKPEEATV